MSENPVPTADRLWTDAQKKAITHVEGDLLVSAAAGSGKTAVLAERCARLVADKKCGVDALLVLTFTEAAANEMRTRIAAAIREKLDDATQSSDTLQWLEMQAAIVERASISTLHAFCSRVLRQHFHEAGIDPAFELIDEEEASLLREETLHEILAAWHRGRPAAMPNDAAATENFADFYEAYGEGRDETVAGLIETVYHMLASSADPAAWKRAALDAYSESGCDATLNRFVRETAIPRLRMLAAAAERAHAAAQSGNAPAQISTTLRNFAAMLRKFEGPLQAGGMAAWDDMRDIALRWEWGRLSPNRNSDDYAALKARTWDATKSEWKKFCTTLLVEHADAMRESLRSLEPHIRTLLALVDDFSAAFAAAKRAQNRLDFSDLERFALDLLTAPKSLAAGELRHRYHHILVDEFQDINPLQAALLEAVRSTERSPKGNLFVVGDVKQSIYGFRLAEPDLFLQRETIAKKPGVDAHVPLQHNFRSQPDLLATMNGIFEKLLTKPVAGLAYNDGHALMPPPKASTEKSAVPESESLLPFTGAPVEVHLVGMDAAEPVEGEEDDSWMDESIIFRNAAETSSTVEAEAEMVAARLKALLAENRGIKRKDGSITRLEPKDIAILLRSMKNKALIFARALSAAGVPVHADLSTGYFDAPEVQEVLAVLNVLDNPLQDIPLTTALLSPFGRFTFDQLANIRLAYDRKSVPFALAAARYAEDVPAPQESAEASRDPKLRADLAAFFAKIARWRAWTRTRPLHEALGAIYGETHIVPYLSGLEAGQQRVANLQMLHQRALQFASFRKQGLHRFLRFIDRLRGQEGDFGEAPVLSEASNVVRIMSVHKSKGLEFPVVFVSGLGGIFNLRGVSSVAVHRNLQIGMKLADLDRNTLFPTATSLAIAEAEKRSYRAEELRLLYVAMTRARDHLVLTGTLKKAEALSDYRDEWSSQRIKELPEDELLKGRTFLSWILPALVLPGLRVQWPEESPMSQPQVVVSMHAPTVRKRAAAPLTPAPNDLVMQRLRAAEPLQHSTDPAAAETMALRLTTKYPHAAFSLRPAVMSVSELKRQARETVEDSEAISAAPLPQFKRAPLSSGSGALEARSRGIATHRLLELVDFARVDSAATLETEIERLLRNEKTLSVEQAKAINRDDVLWFLKTPLAKELAATARTHPQNIQREIPFAWLCPDLPPSFASDLAANIAANIAAEPRDLPTIRGVIDLLHIDASGQHARIIDYKTDSVQTWQHHLPEYQAQMTYYIRAARDILNLPILSATLVFLTPRQLEIVAL